jgi:hypothetical protein
VALAGRGHCSRAGRACLDGEELAAVALDAGADGLFAQVLGLLALGVEVLEVLTGEDDLRGCGWRREGESRAKVGAEGGVGGGGRGEGEAGAEADRVAHGIGALLELLDECLRVGAEADGALHCLEALLRVELRRVRGEAHADAVHQVLAQLGLLRVVRGDEQRPEGVAHREPLALERDPA